MLVLSTPKAGELSGTLSGPARLAGSKLTYQSTPIAWCMAADLEEKTTRYERLLQEALEAMDVAVSQGTPLGDGAAEFETLARAYLEDGQHFRANGDPVNALAAFSYGHAWLDAGARMGLFDVPAESELFTV
jgi:hypothetical protein